MRFEMTLKNRMLPAAVLALAMTGLPPGSQAGTITTHHGSKCSFQGGTMVPGFRAVNGIWNYTSKWTKVGCPVTRVGPATSGGLRVWIDGFVRAGSTLSCELISNDYNGNRMRSVTFTMTGTGSNFDRYLDLAKADIPTYSSQIVECEIPPGAGIYDIEPENLP